eukprot:4200586-Pleurochrysis_carterae.AAC.1
MLPANSLNVWTGLASTGGSTASHAARAAAADLWETPVRCTATAVALRACFSAVRASRLGIRDRMN